MEDPMYKHEMRVWENNQAFARTFFGATSSAGQGALKGMLLINGGASVAMLAFIGNIYNNIHSPELLHAISKSMMIFVWGTFLGAFAFAIVYLSEYFGSIAFEDTKKSKTRAFSLFLNYLSWVIVVLGYLLFLWGAYNASGAFELINPVILSRGT